MTGQSNAAQDREAGLYTDIELARRSLNQLTDHGSQHCLDCQKHRQDGMDALDRLERGMRWMERRGPGARLPEGETRAKLTRMDDTPGYRRDW